MIAFDYFKILNKIPRGSQNEKAVAQYLCDFAKDNGLKYKIDEYFNVKIFKDNNSAKTIILQAHTDMVCEKLKDIEFDFLSQGINTIVEGDFIFAQGTTLGADDGFGVALILEMLENCGDGYPNIEAVFTTQEEIGMNGARYIDCSDLKGKIMLGLDGTSSDEMIVSCAGSSRWNFKKNLTQGCIDILDKKFNSYSIEIGGLLGGHSGEDIDKSRANANKVAFDIFKSILQFGQIRLSKVIGGGKDNAIPREFYAEFICDLSSEQIEKIINDFLIKFATQYSNEKSIEITLKNIHNINTFCLSIAQSKDIIDFVCNFKNGVLDKENDMVVSSINLANIELKEGNILMKAMQRYNSILLGEKEKERIEQYASSKGYQYLLCNNTPFFEDKKGELQIICQKAYNDCGFSGLKKLQIHAGLEGGIFVNKIKDLQVVVMGADLFDIHTPNEKMRISSLDKLSKWIRKIMLQI